MNRLRQLLQLRMWDNHWRTLNRNQSVKNLWRCSSPDHSSLKAWVRGRPCVHQHYWPLAHIIWGIPSDSHTWGGCRPYNYIYLGHIHIYISDNYNYIHKFLKIDKSSLKKYEYARKQHLVFSPYWDHQSWSVFFYTGD